MPTDSTLPPEPRLYVLIPCAGTGQRAGGDGAKQFRQLAGRAMVAHTVAAFRATARPWAGVFLLVSAEDERADVAWDGDRRSWEATARCGGATRAETVLGGLHALGEAGAGPMDWVLVHDAARCLVQPAWIDKLVDACWSDPVGGLLALPLADTLKAADADGRVGATLGRDCKWLAQTPQMFRVGLLTDAVQAALATGLPVTDEASAVEAAGARPLLVAGSAQNLKVTYPDDFALAEAVLEARLRGYVLGAPAVRVGSADQPSRSTVQ